LHRRSPDLISFGDSDEHQTPCDGRGIEEEHVGRVNVHQPARSRVQSASHQSSKRVLNLGFVVHFRHCPLPLCHMNFSSTASVQRRAASLTGAPSSGRRVDYEFRINNPWLVMHADSRVTLRVCYVTANLRRFAIKNRYSLESASATKTCAPAILGSVGTRHFGRRRAMGS